MTNIMTIGVEVIRDPAENINTYRIYKPLDPGPLSADYNVVDNPPEVWVKWNPNLPRPVVFELCANQPITGVGFANCYCVDKASGEETIELYTRIGPCGGSFFLRTDLTRGGATTVEVENWGHHRKTGYVLNLDFSGNVFDPQIYNEGTLPGEYQKPAGCLGLGWLGRRRRGR